MLPDSQAAPKAPVTPASATGSEPIVPQAGTPTEPQKETPPTLDDVRKIAREEATMIADRRAQKGEARITKMIQEKFAALEQTKGTLGLTDQQVLDAKQKIVTEAYSSVEEPEPTTPSTNTQQPQALEAGHPIFDYTMQVYQAAGIDVKATDPEFKIIQQALDDPDGNLGKYGVALQKAISTKRERLELHNETADARTLGGGGQPPGEAQPKSSHDAWEQAYKK